VDDTEDFVNIKQDSQRNQLLMLEIVLTSGTFCLAIVATVASVFGMNLANRSETSFGGFVLVTALASVTAVAAFGGIVWFMRARKLSLI